MEKEIINPFVIEDILISLSPFLNAYITMSARNKFLREAWLKNGKITLFLNGTRDDKLVKLSQYATNLVMPSLDVTANKIFYSNCPDLYFPKVVRIDVTCVGNVVNPKYFPNVRKIHITANKVGGDVDMMYDDFDKFDKFKLLEDVNPHILLSSYEPSHTEIYRNVFNRASKYPSMKISIASDEILNLFLDYTGCDGLRVDQYNVRCWNVVSEDKIAKLIESCKSLEIQMSTMTVLQLSTYVNLIRVKVSEMDKIHKKKIVLLLRKIKNKNTDINVSTILSAIRLNIRELSNLGVDLCINTSLSWLAKFISKSKI